MGKICKKCGIERDYSEFYVGRRVCKSCFVQKNREYYEAHTKEIVNRRHTHYQDDRERILDQKKEYYRARVEDMAVKNRKYQQSHKEEINARARNRWAINSGQVKDKKRLYNEKNKLKLRIYWLQYAKYRYKNDLQFKLARVVRGRLRSAIKGFFVGRKPRTEQLVGCSVENLIKHIESKFTEGMSWANHGCGSGFWCLDHIKPLASYDLTNREQALNASHYTNLQPLWWMDNIKKSDKFKMENAI